MAGNFTAYSFAVKNLFHTYVLHVAQSLSSEFVLKSIPHSSHLKTLKEIRFCTVGSKNSFILYDGERVIASTSQTS